jgi:hypothetical protein
MLWIARLWALWALGFGLVNLVSYSREPDTVTIIQHPHSAFATGNTTTLIHHGPTSSLCFHVVLSAALFFGLLMLHRQYGRLITGVAATCMLLTALYWVLHLSYLLAISNSVAAGFLGFKFPPIIASCLLTVVLQLANIWLALRRPVRNRDGDPHDFPPFATPQSL